MMNDSKQREILRISERKLEHLLGKMTDAMSFSGKKRDLMYGLVLDRNTENSLIQPTVKARDMKTWTEEGVEYVKNNFSEMQYARVSGKAKEEVMEVYGKKARTIQERE